MKRLRYALSIPFWMLQQLVKGFGIACYYTSRAINWLSEGCKNHVYFPIVVAKRWARGVPVWQVEDCLFGGIQPWTDHQRKIADDCPDLMRMVCTCGNPKCKNDGRYVPRPPGAIQLDLRNIPMDMRKRIADGIREQREQLAKRGIRVPPGIEERFEQKPASDAIDVHALSDADCVVLFGLLLEHDGARALTDHEKRLIEAFRAENNRHLPKTQTKEG